MSVVADVHDDEADVLDVLLESIDWRLKPTLKAKFRFRCGPQCARGVGVALCCNPWSRRTAHPRAWTEVKLQLATPLLRAVKLHTGDRSLKFFSPQYTLPGILSFFTVEVALGVRHRPTADKRLPVSPVTSYAVSPKRTMPLPTKLEVGYKLPGQLFDRAGVRATALSIFSPPRFHGSAGDDSYFDTQCNPTVLQLCDVSMRLQLEHGGSDTAAATPASSDTPDDAQPLRQPPRPPAPKAGKPTPLECTTLPEEPTERLERKTGWYRRVWRSNGWLV